MRLIQFAFILSLTSILFPECKTLATFKHAESLNTPLEKFIQGEFKTPPEPVPIINQYQYIITFIFFLLFLLSKSIKKPKKKNVSRSFSHDEISMLELSTDTLNDLLRK